MACADRVAGILDVKSSMEYKNENGTINVENTDSDMAVEFEDVYKRQWDFLPVVTLIRLR